MALSFDFLCYRRSNEQQYLSIKSESYITFFFQISYSASSSLLSDRNQFPSFFRTMPSDDFQAQGLVQLLIHFGWTWIGLLAEDSDYGQQGAHIVQEELTRAGACVAFFETIPTNRVESNTFHIAWVIKNSTANVVVIFSTDYIMIPLLDELVQQRVTGKTWVSTDGWTTSTLLSDEKYSEILSGTLGFDINSGHVHSLGEYFTKINPLNSPDYFYIRQFWEVVFGCKWPDPEVPLNMQNSTTVMCTGNEKLDSVYAHLNNFTTFRIKYNIYTAVRATANALHDMMSCRSGSGPFYNGICVDSADFQPWQLLHYIRNVRLPRKDITEVFFDKDGNPPPRYDIVNWQKWPQGTVWHRKVGEYDGSAPIGETLLFNVSALLWTKGSRKVPLSVCSPSCPMGFRKAAIQGKPICCFQCVLCPQGEVSNQTDSVECFKCPWDQWPNEKQDKCRLKTIEFLSYDEPLGTTLTTCSILFSVLPLSILAIFINCRNTPIVRANNRSVSYLLLLSLTLCFLSSLNFIGHPTKEKCLIRQAAFGIIFALCVSCILAKTIMVVIAFNATKPNSDLRRWVRPQLSYMVITVCTLTQVLLCASWLIMSPPFPEYDIHTQSGTVIAECNDGSQIAFWFMLGYLGLLATISFIVAFLARKLPDSFNEAKFITFSMLAFLSVWLSFIPAYLSTRGKYMVAMEVFAILASSFGLVSCIFFPKCYIILLRSEMNTKGYLMGRGASLTKKVKHI
ncbi:extracellular calcium-sensing receptor-like [Pleurodeles waltl]|uniref:extracellular calcium-sensing receptor-like n=1 Tax=Pleurodeles waltl TaxID=8319 RepID=UPI0037093EBA